MRPHRQLPLIIRSLEAMYIRPAMLGRMGEAEEIGRAVRFLLSSEASFITAEYLVVDGAVVPSQR